MGIGGTSGADPKFEVKEESLEWKAWNKAEKDGATTLTTQATIGSRTFNITVGYNTEAMKAKYGEISESEVEETIKNIVTKLNAEDIIALSGYTVKTSLDAEDATPTVWKGTESYTLKELNSSKDDSLRKLGNTAQKVSAIFSHTKLFEATSKSKEEVASTEDKGKDEDFTIHFTKSEGKKEIEESLPPLESLETKVPSLTTPKGDKYTPFYKTGETAFLGNFHACPKGVEYYGHKFTNSEAAYQWKKFDLIVKEQKTKGHLEEIAKAFEACKDGVEAFQLRKYLEGEGGGLPSGFESTELKEGMFKGKFHSHWKEGLQDQVMEEVLKAKFEQDPELMAKLKATGETYLLEHNEVKDRDRYWSDNNDGSGENMLGRMLMAIRDQEEGEDLSIRLAEKNKISSFAKDFSKNDKAFEI